MNINYPDREKYLSAVKVDLEQNIIYHSLAVEACMAGLYDYFDNNKLLSADDPQKNDWMLSGLIHDIDYAKEFKPTHPEKTKEALAKHNLDITPVVHNIIKAHAPSLTGYQPKNKAEWSLFCADSLTGLIVATTLVYPSKKLADVKLKSILKRFKEPKFAASTRREEIKLCEKPESLNLPLDQFTAICLTSMQSIAPVIGL